MSNISPDNAIKLYFNGSIIVTVFLITALIDSFSNSRMGIAAYGLIANLIALATSYLIVKILNHHHPEQNLIDRFWCRDKDDTEPCYYKSLLYWTTSIALYYPLLILFHKLGINENWIVYGWGIFIAILQLYFTKKAYRIFTSRTSPIFNINTVAILCAATYFMSLTEMNALDIFFILKDIFCAIIITKIFLFRDKAKKVLNLPVTYILYSALFGTIADAIIEHHQHVNGMIHKSLYLFDTQYDLLLLGQALILFFAVLGKYIGNGSDNELIK